MDSAFWPSLVRDFINAVTAHRRAWRVSGTDITMQSPNQAALGYCTPVQHTRNNAPMYLSIRLLTANRRSATGIDTSATAEAHI
ncbi:hypothetical protein N7465_010086 [Penicillium sp. CMV-2018d]|nr:hypothetical protein N7465_010086 [Penicillium sp. CMV-2018d]